MRVVGIILVVLGVIGLIWGGITYTRSRESVSVGPLTATVGEKERVPIPPILGGIALLLGIGLIVAGGRKQG